MNTTTWHEYTFSAELDYFPGSITTEISARGRALAFAIQEATDELDERLDIEGEENGANEWTLHLVSTTDQSDEAKAALLAAIPHRLGNLEAMLAAIAAHLGVKE